MAESIKSTNAVYDWSGDGYYSLEKKDMDQCEN